METLFIGEGLGGFAQIDFALNNAVGGFLRAVISAINEATAVHEIALAGRDCEESKAGIGAPKFQESRKVIGDVTATEERERGVAFDFRTDGGRSGDQARG